ncbi:RNA-directed DNA polymerase, eukaryota [Tanacetum coccineum]
MSRIKAWDDIVEKLQSRLSKWKMNTLLAGGRLTLVKSVLSSTPIYYMSMYKVPSQVLKHLEGVRHKFFIGVDHSKKEKKMAWFKWSRALVSKEKGMEKMRINKELADILEGFILPDMSDRWIWSLTGSGEFSVASSRKFIDDQSIVGANQQTRWIKVVPRKINILAWKIRFDFLPTRLNLSRRGVEIQSIICPTCNKEVESTSHVFFSCSLVRDIYRKIAAWWELSHSDFQKFDDWFDWLLAARVSSKQRSMLEGIFYIAWWLIWNYRNKYLFDSKTPSKEIIFDVLVSKSFDWCKYRSKASFSRVEWMKNPNLITL